MSTPEDRDLDTFVQRRSRLSELYRTLMQEEDGPSPDVDRAVLAAARRALEPAEGGPRRAGPRPARPWLVPVSLAAVIVLSVSAVVLTRSREPAPRPSSSRESLAPAEAMRVPAPRRSSEERAAATAERDAATRPESRASPAVPAPAGSLRGESARRAPAPETMRKAERSSGSLAAGAASPEAGFEHAVQRIRALLAAGRSEEAAAALARLRERYPGRALPEDLRNTPRKVQ